MFEKCIKFLFFKNQCRYNVYIYPAKDDHFQCKDGHCIPLPYIVDETFYGINQKGVNRSKLTDITFVCSLLSLSDIANDSWCQKLKPLQSARGLFQSSDNEFETFLHQTRACLMNRFDSVPRDIEYKRIGYNCNTQQTCPQIPRVKTETFVHFVIWHYTGELKVRSTSIYFNVSAFVV